MLLVRRLVRILLCRITGEDKVFTEERDPPEDRLPALAVLKIACIVDIVCHAGMKCRSSSNCPLNVVIILRPRCLECFRVAIINPQKTTGIRTLYVGMSLFGDVETNRGVYIGPLFFNLHQGLLGTSLQLTFVAGAIGGAI